MRWLVCFSKAGIVIFSFKRIPMKEPPPGTPSPEAMPVGSILVGGGTLL